MTTKKYYPIDEMVLHKIIGHMAMQATYAARTQVDLCCFPLSSYSSHLAVHWNPASLPTRYAPSMERTQIAAVSCSRRVDSYEFWSKVDTCIS